MTEETHRTEPADDAQGYENKTNYLVPQAMDRFDYRRHNVLEKNASLPDVQTLLHASIVTKARMREGRSTEWRAKCR